MGGDKPAPTTQESTDQMMKAWINNFPEFLNVTLAGLQPTAKAQLGANQATSLDQAQLQADIFRNIGPQVNQIGNEINRTNALAQNATDQAVLEQSVPMLQKSYEAAQVFDKPYYDTRDAMAKQYQALFSGQDPNQLSGSERSEVERGLARESAARGTSNSPSNIEVLNQASKYGSALDNKRSAVERTLQTANQFLQPAKTNVDTFQVATGRASTPNQGAAQIGTANTNAGSQAFDLSKGLLSNVSALKQQENQINSQRRDPLDRSDQILDNY